jgi:hypothetical protein
MLCLADLLEFCNGIAQKNHENSPLAITKAIKKAVMLILKMVKMVMKPK